jgi:tetratricopeptide (TPR) repeat protein
MRRTLAGLAICGFLVGLAQAQGRPPEEAVRRNQRGVVYQNQGKLEEAVAEFRQAVQTDPGYVVALMNLAHVYSLQGRSDEAIAEYRKVLERQPENALARNNLGVLYDGQGLYDEAIREFEQVLERDPNNATAVKNIEVAKQNRANVQARDQEIDRAVKAFEARPRDPRAAYAVARLHAVHSQPEQALLWLTKAMELGLDNVEYLTVDPALARLRNDPRFPKIERRPAPSEQPR